LAVCTDFCLVTPLAREELGDLDLHVRIILKYTIRRKNGEI